jgi:hypothetical protein
MRHSGTSRLPIVVLVAVLLITAGCGGDDDGPTGTGGGGGGGGGTATVVGSVNMPDDASGVIANGNYAYVNASGSGLQVVDISNKTSPSIATALGTITTIGGIEGFFGSGFGYVYPCANLGGFHIVDVGNPLAPSLNSTYNTPATANDITFSSGSPTVACIADGASGVQFYYGATWTNTSYDTPELATGVAANDSYCFATDLPSIISGSGSLIVIDISNPASPSLTQTLPLPGSPSGIAIKGNYLYIAAGDPGMYVINITNPASPSIAGQTGSLPASGPIAVDPTRNLVYLGTTDTAGFPTDGLKVINVANPASPQVIDTVNLPNWTTGVAYYDNHVYATTTDITGPAASTLQIIDVSGF